MKKIWCIVFSLMLVMAFFAVGCDDIDTNEPKGVVEAFWSALQDGDFETAEGYLHGQSKEDFDVPAEEEEEIVEAMLGVMNLETQSQEIDNGIATVVVEVTTPCTDDIDKKMLEVTNKMMMDPDMKELSKEDLEEKIIEEFLEVIDDVSTETVEEKVGLEKIDGEWKITEEPDLME